MAEINENGELVLKFTDGEIKNLGKVQGTDGKNGVDGEDGKDGANGTDGLSAYQIWLNEGNSGTEEDFLVSLKGADGADGQNGKDGVDGNNGNDGVSCTHSWNGTTLTVTSASGTSSADLKGEKGDQGERGLQGEQGERGEKGDKGDTGATGEKGDKGDTYTLTDDDKTAIAGEVVTIVTDDGIPDYWDEHLAEKIAIIKALQDESGKDCFSFIVMTDLHYPSNLGKRSPAIAKRLMDECVIKYALCLGDTQSRGAKSTKEETIIELDNVAQMLSPLDGHLLRTQGNHDGSYGTYDIDGDGTLESGETYVYDLPPAELYGQIYRKVAALDGTHFDESGTAFYVDDTAHKVRFILLNTHCNEWAQKEDGTQKYPNIHNFRFTQVQYDFLVNDALVNGLDDGWSLVVGSHVPLSYNEAYAAYWGGAVGDQNGGDNGLMRRMLDAFNNKATFSDTFAGTANGGVLYTNLADTSDAYWKTDTRFSSSSKTETTSDAEGQIVSNYIPAKKGNTVRIKGMTVDSNLKLAYYIEKPQDAATGLAPLTGISEGVYTIDEDGVITYTLYDYDTEGNQFGYSQIDSYAYLRISGTPSDGAENVAITIDEPIVEAEHGYDYVSVDADFTAAKGEIVGCFAGHMHMDYVNDSAAYPIIATRCDAQQENGGAGTELYDERVANTVTEQSFDVFTVNKATRTITATKIGAGEDRKINY